MLLRSLLLLEDSFSHAAENEQLLQYGHAYQLSIRMNVKTIDAHARVLYWTIMKYIEIEMIVEMKQILNILLAVTVYN